MRWFTIYSTYPVTIPWLRFFAFLVDILRFLLRLLPTVRCCRLVLLFPVAVTRLRHRRGCYDITTYQVAQNTVTFYTVAVALKFRITRLYIRCYLYLFTVLLRFGLPPHNPRATFTTRTHLRLPFILTLCGLPVATLRTRDAFAICYALVPLPVTACPVLPPHALPVPRFGYGCTLRHV